MTPAERIAKGFFEEHERVLHERLLPDTDVPVATWDDVTKSTAEALIETVQRLLDRGVISGGTGIDRYKQRQADAAEFVQDLARSAGYDRIEGFIILYAFKEGLAAFGIGSVASDGQVWDALKRINEKQLAGYLFQALRAEQSQQNGGGGLIVPGH